MRLREEKAKEPREDKVRDGVSGEATTRCQSSGSATWGPSDSGMKTYTAWKEEWTSPKPFVFMPGRNHLMGNVSAEQREGTLGVVEEYDYCEACRGLIRTKSKLCRWCGHDHTG